MDVKTCGRTRPYSSPSARPRDRPRFARSRRLNLGQVAGVHHRPRGSFRPELWEGKGRGVRGTRRLDPNLYGSRSASRARWLWPPLRPDESGASGEAQELSLREARPSVGPHVPQPATRSGLAFPARAPIPPHVTTPRERAPRVDGTTAEKHNLGNLSSEFARNVHISPARASALEERVSAWSDPEPTRLAIE